MRIVLITQDDPFYLPGNLEYLLQHLPDGAEVVACVVSKVSPFGKKESFLAKARRTLDVFGAGFFLHYSIEYLASKLPGHIGVRDVLEKYGVPEPAITGSLNSEMSLDTLRNFAPDLLISIAGNEIFRKPLIELAPQGCLNLHTALLPKYRGLMPSFWVLKNGEKETGVSVFYVDEGIDSGPILVQERIDIGSMTQRELIRESKAAGMRAIIKAVGKIRDGDTATTPNDAAESTYFSFPTRMDVEEFRRSGAKFY